ncbi:oligosaccharide flippase family protein [Parabacteroides sp. OttesenSCG-928-G06]|nr:oligosaccharide flippase family protein [Parabacteroides sp. OttesenSCG-928-G06]
MFIHSLYKNKIIGYVVTRYATMGVQFVNSILIAAFLGPFYLGVWGFANMILQYITQVNLGLPYSLNVMLSIHKNDPQRTRTLLSTSLLLYIILAVVLAVLTLIAYFSGFSLGKKFEFDNYIFYVVCIAILTHFNSLYTNYFRVKNRLGVIIFYQSIIPLLTLLLLFCARGETLLYVLLWTMLGGHLMSFILYTWQARSDLILPDKEMIQPLLRKGWYLFLYNACFYMIMLSTRSVVSEYYEVEELGFFSFAFTLANIIVLLFDSFNFLIYPKTINRFSQAPTTKEVLRILNLIRENYITAIHLVMYVFIILFPYLITLFPQYETIGKCFSLIAMTVVFYSNCFVFSSLLTAFGAEKKLSLLAAFALLLNVLFALFISCVLKAGYAYVILSTMLAYIIYNVMLAFVSYRKLKVKMSLISLLKDNFPVRLFLPFFLCLFFVIMDFAWFYSLALLCLFLVLNRKQLWNVKRVIVRIIADSSVINI